MITVEKFKQTVLGSKIEHEIRYALGQRLKGTQNTNKPYEEIRVDHLRFEMSGNYKHIKNCMIFSLFKFPLDYFTNPDNLEWYSPNENKEYQFFFYKGVGHLCRKGQMYKSYSGYGTVDILIDLVLEFKMYNNFLK